MTTMRKSNVNKHLPHVASLKSKTGPDPEDYGNNDPGPKKRPEDYGIKPKTRPVNYGDTPETMAIAPRKLWH